MRTYTKENLENLPTDDTDLAAEYSAQEYTDSDTDDQVYVNLVGQNYLVHQFRIDAANDTPTIQIRINTKTNVSPTEWPVYLEIYNYQDLGWETLDTEDAAAINTDFDLTATIDTNVADYFDGSNFVTVRVYQKVQEVVVPPVSGNTPIMDLTGTYMGQSGRLYSGSNSRPSAYETDVVAESANIVRRDASGNPSGTGSIGFLSIGMSNTKQEFSVFMDRIAVLKSQGTVDNKVTAVNGAQGGVTLDRWADPNDSQWTTVESLVANKSLTAAQIQVVWLKCAHNDAPTIGTGSFTDHTAAYETELVDTCQNIIDKYPNVKIIYISSRTHSWTDEWDTPPYNSPSPEPYAYEEGFPCKWVIQDKIDGNLPTLPYLLWGPYLWCNGDNARSDGRTWGLEMVREDDLTHPSELGKAEAADMLEEFFLNDTTNGWFLA